MKIINAKKTERGIEIIVILKVFIFFNSKHQYIKKNNVYYCDYERYGKGLEKLRNPYLIKCLDEELKLCRYDKNDI